MLWIIGDIVAAGSVVVCAMVLAVAIASKLPEWLAILASRYIRHRKPNYIIGPPSNPYIKRWWLLPRNRFFNCYIHVVLRSDDDRALHDHPYWNLSYILRGGYREYRPGPDFATDRTSLTVVRCHPGALIGRRCRTPHRLVVDGQPALTLFFHGPRLHNGDWFFYCPKGAVHQKDFVDARDSGNIGKGCD